MVEKQDVPAAETAAVSAACSDSSVEKLDEPELAAVLVACSDS